MTLISMIS